MIERMFSTKVLERALDAAWLRNETISQNTANIDTPGYKRKTVAFEEYLTKQVKMPLLRVLEPIVGIFQ